MGRKNKRKKSAYYRSMKGDPRKMIEKKYIRQGINEAGVGATALKSAIAGEQCIAPKRGEIWFAELGCHPGTSVQEGCRPVLVMSNDTANHYSGTLTVIPLTSKMKKRHLPTHTMISSEDCPSIDPSMVLAEQVTTIGKAALLHCVGKISAGKLYEVETAVLVQMGIIAGSRNNLHESTSVD